jgi:two-component system cell cycle response regulator DivK
MPKSVLIVEDDEMSLKLMSHILEAVGLTWAAARDGKSALDMAASLQPDLILLDIQLPGMSGLEVAKLLKADATLRRTPIIAVTAFAMVGDKDRILEAGCDDYISKPIEVAHLASMIRKAIGIA